MILIYTPCKNKREAQRIARQLLEDKFIACANILPSDSLYYWKGKLCTTKESILLLKTVKKHVAAIKQRIIQMHSYSIPAILVLDAQASKEFSHWINQNT